MRFVPNEGHQGHGAFDGMFRVVRDGEVYVLEVATISWPGPDRPVTVWRRWRRWRREPDEARLAEARRRALECSRFFRHCHWCGEWHAAGHMFDVMVCQGCASSDLGVVF